MSVLLELVKADDRQGALFRGLQAHKRCHAILVGLLPARRTDAPVVPWFQARELKSGHRRAQVIALGLAVTEKLFSHHAADAVLAVIRWIGLTETIAIPTRHRLTTATLQWVTKNVPGRRKFGATAGHLSAQSRGSLPKDWHILTSDG